MALNVRSLEFNGTNRYTKLDTRTSIRGMDNFTVVAWVKPDAANTSQYRRAYVERQGTGGLIRPALAVYKGKLRWEFSPKDGVADTNYDFSYSWDDRWHMVGYVARVSGDNPSYNIYLDGIRVAEGNLIRPDTVTAVSDTAPLGVYLGNHSLHTSGGESFPTDRYYHGKLDELTIFSEAKNDTDILSYFTSKEHITVGDVDVFSSWRFDENSSAHTDADNPTWTGTSYQAGVATNISTIDRPYLGDGLSDTTAPSAPTSIATDPDTVTADRFTASWNASTDNVWVRYYSLEVDTINSFASATTYNNGLNLSREVKGLINGLPYFWRVRAYDEAGNPSAYSATQTFTTDTIGDVTDPNTPTGLVASSITYSSFSVSWTDSTSPDVIGFKIDVATDAQFKNYLPGFRNLRLGNVLTYNVTGTEPLRTYYVRLRAFDEAENESVNSSVLTVQTPSRPDTSPPLTVELLAPTSISSTAATLNWEEGQDDIGVVSYVVDVSTNDQFGDFLQIGAISWEARNVGNVLSVRVEGLTPDTAYSYRVRAVDTAGNVSDNPIYGVTFNTTGTSINEGGYRDQTYIPAYDTSAISFNADVPYDAVAVLYVYNSAGTVYETYINFDASTVVGQIKSAMLRVYVDLPGNVPITVTVDNIAISSTMTYNTKPTIPASPSTVFTALLDATWYDIDVTHMLLDGATNYTFRFTVPTNSNTLVQFESKEAANPPQLVIESDPSTATIVEGIKVAPVVTSTMRTNLIKNPHGESGATTFWNAYGGGTTTLSSTALTPYTGTRALRTTTNGASVNQGIEYSRTNLPAVAGQEYTFTAQVRLVSGPAAPALMMQIVEWTSGGGYLTETALPFTPTTEWQRYSVSRKLTHASTANISCIIQTVGSAQAITFDIGQSVIETGLLSGGLFDGNTPGARWTGTTNASTSQMPTGTLVIDSTYSGDTPADNSAAIYFKRADSPDLIYWPAVNLYKDHSTSLKRVRATIGPSMGPYNLFKNPSIEAGTAQFSANGAASISIDTTQATSGAQSLLVSSTAALYAGVITNAIYIGAGVAFSWNFKIKGTFGQSFFTTMHAYNASNTFISQKDGTFAFTGEWQQQDGTWVTPANTAYVRLIITNGGGAIAMTFNVDDIIVHHGATALPYLDGSRPGGMWEGAAHASATALVIDPSTEYDVLFRYTDDDTIINSGTTTFDIADRFKTTDPTDNLTTAGVITSTTSVDKISIRLPYIGDDNSNLTVTGEWKRFDLPTYSRFNVIVRRADKEVAGDIPGLLPGTRYDVRMKLTDPDGIYNADVNGYVSAQITTLTNFGAAGGLSTVSFGGFILQGRPDNSIVVSEHDAFGLPDRRVQVEDLPRVHGAVELSDNWGRRTIRMAGTVDGSSREQLEDNKQALKRALAKGRQRLVIDTLANVGRYYLATCNSLSIVESPQNIRHLPWEAEFLCADPFAYDSQVSITPEITVPHGGTLVPINGGDLETDPVIKVRTLGLVPISVAIVNRTTGERIAPVQTIVSGDRLVIDTEKKAVYKNGVEIDYAGSFIHMNSGSNKLEYRLTSNDPAPSVLTEITWNQRYL